MDFAHNRNEINKKMYLDTECQSLAGLPTLEGLYISVLSEYKQPLVFERKVELNYLSYGRGNGKRATRNVANLSDSWKPE